MGIRQIQTGGNTREKTSSSSSSSHYLLGNNTQFCTVGECGTKVHANIVLLFWIMHPTRQLGVLSKRDTTYYEIDMFQD